MRSSIRAHKINELDDKVFRPLLPKLRALAGAARVGVVGSAAEREAGVRARGTVEGKQGS